MTDSVGQVAMVGGGDEDGCVWAGAVWRPPPGKRGAALHAALVQRPCSCIRRLAGDRARQMRFTRFLRNASVTSAEMSAQAAARTAECVAGREVVAIQDTTELMLGGRGARANGFGPVGRGGATGGLLLHPVLAVEAGTGALLGLVDAKAWNRDGGKAAARRGRATAAKESRRWLDGAARAGEVLAAASSVTLVADRESDIYEQFVSRPANVHLIIRAAQDRRIGAADQPALLFAFADGLPEQGRLALMIPASPGRRARAAELAVRFSPVLPRKPRHGAAGDLPDKVRLTLVDVREASRPAEGEPVHWRLLTTHAVESLGAARRVLDLYRRRWIIEEFFRTLKTAGFDIEAAEIGDPRAMSNFVAAASVAAVTVMQLVQARDGTTAQRLEDAFDPADQPLLEALSARLEGKTARQKNPHAKHSLAFAAWIIGRLGGWDGYYGKAGPRVLSRGLHDFQRIKYGSTLALQNV
jgi:DDE family transposase